MKRRLIRIVGILMVICILGYIAACVVLSMMQHRLIFHAEQQPEQEMLARASRKGMAPWKDSNGQIIGWYKPNPGASARFLLFHGVAGNALWHTKYVDEIQKIGDGARWEARLFEYPGFGSRAGTPSESTILAAARAAISEMQKEDQRPIYVVGESLGSGPACSLASAMPEAIRGVLLLVPFACFQELAEKHITWAPLGLILQSKFDNLAALKKYSGRVVVVVAELDEVVTAEQGRRLHASYAGPKLLLELANISHNTFPFGPEEDWVKKADQFLLAE